MNTLSAASSLAGALQGLAGESKELAIGSAIIDTYVGANKAFAQGGMLGFISAAAVIAGGLANVKKIMETNNNVICIAMSSIFSTGINIKNIHMIIFAGGGKSFIRTIQSIGRGLRLHKDKEKLAIIDLADDLRYGQRHVEKRKEIYMSEKIPFSITEVVEN